MSELTVTLTIPDLPGWRAVAVRPAKLGEFFLNEKRPPIKYDPGFWGWSVSRASANFPNLVTRIVIILEQTGPDLEGFLSESAKHEHHEVTL